MKFPGQTIVDAHARAAGTAAADQCADDAQKAIVGGGPSSFGVHQ
jgi:hypothetical protein